MGIVSQMVVSPTLVWIAVLTYHGNKSYETTHQKIDINDMWASMEVSLRDHCRSKVEEARLSGSQLLRLTEDDLVSVLNIPLGDATNREGSLRNFISHLHSKSSYYSPVTQIQTAPLWHLNGQFALQAKKPQAN